MKRKYKNIIMCAALAVMIITTIFTVCFGADGANGVGGAGGASGGGQQGFGPMAGQGGEMGERPELPSGNGGGQSGGGTSGGETNGQSGNGAGNGVNGQPGGGSVNGGAPGAGMSAPDGQQMPSGIAPDDFGGAMGQATNNNAVIYYCIFALESLIIFALILYLAMSQMNKLSLRETFANADKIIIYILALVILTVPTTIGLKAARSALVGNSVVEMRPMEESAEKDEVQLDGNNILSAGEINLSNYSSDVTITSGGTYEFSGSFAHAIVVKAGSEDAVELVLDGVTIANTQTAAIIGLSGQSLTIRTEGKSTLSDGGNSEYDGCIYSEIPLVFEGDGTLTVNGNQTEGEGIATEAQNMTFNSGTYVVTSADDGLNAGGDGATITINDGVFYINAGGDGIDSNRNAVINGGRIFVIGSDVGGDAGIDTDDGFTINGGVVVALGSDMIETPLASSAQNSIAFTLDNAIAKGVTVTLCGVAGDDGACIAGGMSLSFVAPKSFRTIIISSADLTNGTYALYEGGSHSGSLSYGIYDGGSYTAGSRVEVGGSDSFVVAQGVSYFGGR